MVTEPNNATSLLQSGTSGARPASPSKVEPPLSSQRTGTGDEAASYRRILRSSTIIGASSVINVLIGIVRSKVVASLLGPAGVGIVGLYQGLFGTGATVASLGIATPATRQIAEAVGKGDPRALAVVRRALFWGTLTLATVGALTFWLLRTILASRVIGSTAHSGNVGWLAIAVAVTVLATSQTALLQGMRRIGDLSRITVYGSVITTILGSAMIWTFRSEAIVAYVITACFVGAVVAVVYVRRLPPVGHWNVSFKELARDFGGMASMGLVLCAYSVLEQVTFLGIRSHINAVLGTVRLGQFQAGWTIAVQYLTFVVGPLASDYFPRLSEEFSDRVKTRTLINQQTAIGLQLGCPIIVAMIGFAPLIMKILYSAEFVDAVPMLRLLLLSDVVKLMNWPLGYAVLAAGDSKAFLRQGPAILAVLFVTIYLCVPVLGLKGVGAGLLVSQSVSLVWVAYYVYRKMGFRFDRRVLIIGMTYLGLAIGCLLISNYSAIAGMAVSSLIAAFGGAFAWKDIKAKVKRK